MAFGKDNQKFEKRDNSGVLFVNENKEDEHQPHFFGTGTINGEEVNIAAWKNKSKKTGKSFLSLRFSDPTEFNKKNSKNSNKAKKEDDDFAF